MLPFTLHYYDQLASQQNPIQLSVSALGVLLHLPVSKHALCRRFWSAVTQPRLCLKTMPQVSSNPGGGWTSRVGSTMADRGRCEGASVPPLEVVIETRWPDVAVKWNGTEPIL
jgi:hypothetical protein